MPEFDSVKVKDQLGKPEDKGFTVKRFTEDMIPEPGPMSLEKESLGHVWIVGSLKNGIVGTWTGTEDGQQLVVGPDGDGGRDTTLHRITNPFNTFREHFRSERFKESATADWDTTNYRLAMSSSSNQAVPYNTQATFKEIFYNQQTPIAATISIKETKFGNDIIKYYLSPDAGSTWEELENNVRKVLTNTGQDLRLKVVFIGNGANATYIEDVNVNYEV